MDAYGDSHLQKGIPLCLELPATYKAELASMISAAGYDVPADFFDCPDTIYTMVGKVISEQGAQLEKTILYCLLDGNLKRDSPNEIAIFLKTNLDNTEDVLGKKYNFGFEKAGEIIQRVDPDLYHIAEDEVDYAFDRQTIFHNGIAGQKENYGKLLALDFREKLKQHQEEVERMHPSFVYLNDVGMKSLASHYRHVHDWDGFENFKRMKLWLKQKRAEEGR